MFETEGKQWNTKPCYPANVEASTRQLFLLVQNPKETKQAHGNLLDFVVRQYLAEFLLINGFELVNGLATQLMWCFHAVTVTAHGRRPQGG